MRRRERWAERVVERDRDMRGKRRKEGKKKRRRREGKRKRVLRGWRRKRSWGRGGNRRRCGVKECGEAG